MTEKETGIVKSEQVKVLTIESNVMVMIMIMIMTIMITMMAVVVMMIMMMMTTTTMMMIMTTTTSEELFRTWFTLFPVLYSDNSTELAVSPYSTVVFALPTALNLSDSVFQSV